MRGEDGLDGLPRMDQRGSPPHARGRLVEQSNLTLQSRITPACAGKTGAVALRHAPWTDHPRMRGEDAAESVTKWWRRGSPPHARGRPTEATVTIGSERITPACAGKTLVQEVRPAG